MLMNNEKNYIGVFRKLKFIRLYEHGQHKIDKWLGHDNYFLVNEITLVLLKGSDFVIIIIQKYTYKQNKQTLLSDY